jgi:hypothetical protein
VGRGNSQPVFRRGIRERCAAVTECSEFVERSGAIDVRADRFASAACAACCATGPDTACPGIDYEQRFEFGAIFEFELRGEQQCGGENPAAGRLAAVLHLRVQREYGAAFEAAVGDLQREHPCTALSDHELDQPGSFQRHLRFERFDIGSGRIGAAGGFAWLQFERRDAPRFKCTGRGSARCFE